MDQTFIPTLRASAQRLGIDPVHLLTAISYETGGKLDPGLWGGKNNNYLGLIQFGPQERAKYGVHEKQSATEQMGAVENFLRDRGIKPGMGLPDIYSTINAGSPGLYNRSDTANGGAPGTVMDKVQNQMAGHRARAQAMLGTNTDNPTGVIPPAPIPQPFMPANAMASEQTAPLFSPQQQPPPTGQQPSPLQSFFASPPAGPSNSNDLAAWWSRQNPQG